MGQGFGLTHSSTLPACFCASLDSLLIACQPPAPRAEVADTSILHMCSSNLSKLTLPIPTGHPFRVLASAQVVKDPKCRGRFEDHFRQVIWHTDRCQSSDPPGCRGFQYNHGSGTCSLWKISICRSQAKRRSGVELCCGVVRSSFQGRFRRVPGGFKLVVGDFRPGLLVCLLSGAEFAPLEKRGGGGRVVWET